MYPDVIRYLAEAREKIGNAKDICPGYGDESLWKRIGEVERVVRDLIDEVITKAAASDA